MRFLIRLLRRTNGNAGGVIRITGWNYARTSYGYVYSYIKDCVFINNYVSSFVSAATVLLEFWYGVLEDCVFQGNGGK